MPNVIKHTTNLYPRPLHRTSGDHSEPINSYFILK